jgi:S1-C subfamily serine protease
VVTQLIREGKVVRGFLGISGQTVPLPVKVIRYFQINHDSGVQIIDVSKGSPADLAGLKEGDVVITLDAQAIGSVDDIHRKLSRESIGKSLEMAILRGWTLRLEKVIIPAANPG